MIDGNNLMQRPLLPRHTLRAYQKLDHFRDVRNTFRPSDELHASRFQEWLLSMTSGHQFS